MGTLYEFNYTIATIVLGGVISGLIVLAVWKRLDGKAIPWLRLRRNAAKPLPPQQSPPRLQRRCVREFVGPGFKVYRPGDIAEFREEDADDFPLHAFVPLDWMPMRCTQRCAPHGRNVVDFGEIRYLSPAETQDPYIQSCFTPLKQGETP